MRWPDPDSIAATATAARKDEGDDGSGIDVQQSISIEDVPEHGIHMILSPTKPPARRSTKVAACAICRG